jgi:hypothetical protein
MDLVRTDDSEERIATIIRMTIIGELGTTLAVPCLSILATLMMDPVRSSETSILTGATLRNIQEDGILQVH